MDRNGNCEMYKLLLSSNLGTETGVIKEKGFWKSIEVYFERPNILNQRIFGSHILEAVEIVEDVSCGCDLFVNHLIRRNSCGFKGSTTVTLARILQGQTYISQRGDVGLKIQSWIREGKSVLCLRKILPRMKPRFEEEFELVIINAALKYCVFFPLSNREMGYRLTPKLCYKLSLNVEKHELSLQATSLSPDELLTCETPSVKWLKSSVFPKISKWCSSESEENGSKPPLHLIPIEDYNNLRLKLRETHAEKFIKMWPDDGTDPSKFVHEDIAIAAYLICIWERESREKNLTEKQSFVDLGCGNGLLVYILASEGYRGIGVDLRKRQLWDLLGPETVLKELTISPSSHCLFPEYDWLIGNHSDELTPWIPIIAARSSYNMRVFLLPCCPFTFDGKFERKQGGVSQYQSYLAFVENLCNVIGFCVERDKLRIPSTKRSCFVCFSRHYLEQDESEMDTRRIKFIKDNSKGNKLVECKTSQHGDEKWAAGFIPRPKKTAVTNCTQLDRKFLDDVVLLIANLLLSRGESYHEIMTSSGIKQLKFGGTIRLDELANCLDSDIKIKLKQQNGGLQTLIRNHRHIFEIKEGRVLITKPLSKHIEIGEQSKNKSSSTSKKLIKFQSRTCWFFSCHPQGCPLDNLECRYSHNSN